MPCGPIYSVADQLTDPHVAARGVIERVRLESGEEVAIPAVAPHLSATPGRTTWPGPRLGAHNAEVYGDLLGLSSERLADLASRGVPQSEALAQGEWPWDPKLLESAVRLGYEHLPRSQKRLPLV